MRYLSLFSGIEAASVAWGPLGWEPVAFCEIEPFPSAVLAHRFPDVPNLGDITKVDWEEFKESHGPVDVVVGGSPCQSFSIAGNREGLAGASGLMWEYVRAIRHIMPRFLLWENVPGCLSSGPGKGQAGEDFACLLRALDDLGYGLAWRVLDAQFFGVAQRRRRVFLVGSPGDGGAERACAVLFEPESLRWDFKTGRAERQRLAADAPGGPGGPAGGAVAFQQNQRDEVRLMGGDGSIAGCVNSCRATKNENIVALQSDGSTSLNSHGMGYDDSGAAYTCNTTDRQSVCMPMDLDVTPKFYGDGEPAPTLRRGGEGGTNYAVAYGFKFHQGAGAGNIGFGEVSPTCTGDWHNPAVLTMHQNQCGDVHVADDMAGTLTANSSVSRQQLLCMTDTQTNSMVDSELTGTLAAHISKGAPVVCERIEE